MNSKGVQQFPLGLTHDIAYGVENFITSPCNVEAVSWIRRWPDWPGGGLVLYGPAGCGKSHLSIAWSNIVGATVVNGSELPDTVRELSMKSAAIVVEDANDAHEIYLLHLYNALIEERKTILLTSLYPPQRWSIVLPDLYSRISSLSTVGIGEPDDTLLEAIMVKQFSDRQLRVKPEVLNYLLARMERSFDSARKLVLLLDELALDRQNSVTVSLAGIALARLEEESGMVVSNSQD